MSAINWVGKNNDRPDRVGRGSSIVSLSETRWIVPAKPYEAPRGSWERAENAIVTGVAVAALLFGFCIIILGSL